MPVEGKRPDEGNARRRPGMLDHLYAIDIRAQTARLAERDDRDRVTPSRELARQHQHLGLRATRRAGSVPPQQCCGTGGVERPRL